MVNPELAGGDSLHRVRIWPMAPWVLADLQTMANDLQDGDVIAEVGCGAGNYARALAAHAASRLTLDLPIQATARPWSWPIVSDSVDLLLCVDSLQYEGDLDSFVREVARVTRTTKLFVLVTRSRQDLQEDGLSVYFPRAVQAAMPLVAEVPILENMLANQGLHCVRRARLSGQLPIDESMLRAIANRGLTGLATLTEEEFAEGVDHMKNAIHQGNAQWNAHYTVLVCRKVRPWNSDRTPPAGMDMM
jgi:SAM-dependent methyltransferase